MSKLILYFTAGYPNRDTFVEFLSRLSYETIDYVEIGFPSPDPKYDGPIIRRTHSSAEFSGILEYSDVFLNLASREVKIYSLAYASDIVSNLDVNIATLKEVGFSGILMPDLLIDYFGRSEEIIGTVHNQGLEVIPFFNPSTPDRVITRISSLTNSWIYYGIQPSTGIVMPADLTQVVSRIRALVPGREIDFGFGIRSNEQVKKIIEAGGDGIAIGSALVEMLDKRNFDTFEDYISTVRGVLNAY